MPPGEFRSQFDSEPLRVYRGGSWFSTAVYARAAYRSWYGPGSRGGNLGFRLCRDADHIERMKEVTE